MTKVLFVVTSEGVETKLGIKDLEQIPSKKQLITFDGIKYSVIDVDYITAESHPDKVDAKAELAVFEELEPKVEVW